MTETTPLSPLDTSGLPIYVRIIWFLGIPTVFAAWLLYYVLYVQPVQATALINLSNGLAIHEVTQQQRITEIIRALNYDEAILRAICLAIIPYRNKEEALKCQPVFIKEFELK